MNEISHELSPAEIAEIERHKYFLSEKAGHDVGWDYAEQDWMAKYGRQTEQRIDDGQATADAGPFSKFLKRLLAK